MITQTIYRKIIIPFFPAENYHKQIIQLKDNFHNEYRIYKNIKLSNLHQ